MSKKSVLSGLFAAVLIASLLFCTTPGHAYPVNLGFETGKIDGWTGYLKLGGSISIPSWTPHDPVWGSYFLQLTNAMLQQTFSLDANEALSGRLQAQPGGTNFAQALIYGGDKQLSEWGSTGVLVNWSFTALTSGLYTIQYLALGTGNFDAVPIPTTVYLLGAGLIGLVGLRRKFFRK
jgi:hypothetical protein